MRPSDRPWLMPVLVGLACAALYVQTLHPSVPGGDAGELIAVAYRLEVAHPPGYPLFTLLAKLATLVPVGSIAWRVNLLSALTSASAAGLVAATVAAASGSTGAAVVAALLFACSPLVWTYAVSAEVFALNALVVALLCYLTLRWRQRGTDGGALAVAVVAGLGLAHHHAIVFYAAPVTAWLLWCGRPEILTGRRLAALGLALVAGLAWYVYLPLAARTATTLSWGDPSSLDGFVHHFLRRDYGTFRLGPGVAAHAPRFAERLAAWGEHTLDATLVVGTLLAIGGALSGLTTRPATRAWVALWLGALALYVGAFHALANLPVDDPLYRAVTARFWLQSDVVVFVFLGLGFAALTRRLPRMLGPVLALGSILLVVGQAARGYLGHIRLVDDTVARYGRALLEPLAPETILLTRGDLVTNVTRYLQTCEGVRPDVVILDQELLTKPWYVARAAREHAELRFPGTVYDPARADGFAMRAFLDANAAERPIAVYPDWKPGDPSVEGVYELTPSGLALTVSGIELGLAERHARSALALRTLDDYGWRRLDAYPPGTWERVAREDVWQARARFGLWLLTQALARDDDARLLNSARTQLERAEHGHPDPPWFLFRNLGIVYERLAPGEPKLRERQLVAWRRYLATAPANDDGRSAIAATVSRLEAAPTD